jgi:hypothetical protein
MRHFLLHLIGFFWICSSHAQTNLSGMPEQDCFGAIPICQTTYSTTASYTGSGNIPNEINNAYSCLSSGEKNDVWYLFRTHSAGTISFSITPVNVADDYDWAVFNITQKSCSNIYNDSSMEVSCNYDANIGCNGVTGANGNFGPCGQTESVISVLANESYLINISNYSSSQSGYTIDFSASTALIFDVTPPHASNDTIACTQTSLKVKFNEPVLCSTLTSSGSDMILADDNGNLQIPVSITFVGCDSAHPYITEAELFFAQPFAGSNNFYLLAANGSDGNTISDLCGNFVSVSDTIAKFYSYNNMTVDLGSDLWTCSYDTLPVLYSASTPVANYNWYFNNTLLNQHFSYLQPADTGQYILQAYLGSFCQATDTIYIIRKQAVSVSLGTDINICKESSFPEINCTTNSSHVMWYLNNIPYASDTNIFTPADTGSVVVQAWSEGYCMAFDTLHVSFYNVPLSLLSDTVARCVNSQIELLSGINDNGTFLWIFDGDTLQNNQSWLDVTKEGFCKMFFTTTDGCMVADSTHVVNKPEPEAPQLNCPILTANGNKFTWQPYQGAVRYYISTNGENYNSLPQDITSYIAALGVNAVSLYVYDGSCNSKVAVSENCNPKISTLWDKDDGFVVTGLSNPISLTVYDVQGREVYTTKDYRNNWSGQGLENGIYLYTLKSAKAVYFYGKFLMVR